VADEKFTDCTLKVGMQPLRAGLLAVVAHADRPKLGDEDLATARVRLIAGRDELLVAAMSSTDHGTSSAVAAVAIIEDDRKVRFAAWDGPMVVDVHPTMVRDLIRALRPAKGDDGQPEGWAEITLDAGHGEVTVRDVSGLWPGRASTVTALATRADYPDVVGAVGRALTAAAGTYKPFVPGRGLTTRFIAAERAYEQELEARPTGTAESSGWVVICGDLFAGSVEGFHKAGNTLKHRDKRWQAHLARHGVGQLKAV
jgi:hypothetical protein